MIFYTVPRVTHRSPNFDSCPTKTRTLSHFFGHSYNYHAPRRPQKSVCNVRATFEQFAVRGHREQECLFFVVVSSESSGKQNKKKIFQVWDENNLHLRISESSRSGSSGGIHPSLGDVIVPAGRAGLWDQRVDRK